MGSWGAGTGRPIVPNRRCFLILFVLFALASTFGMVPASLASVTLPLSRFCILMAMAAIGLMLPWRALLAYGWRPVLLIAILSLGLLAFVTSVAGDAVRVTGDFSKLIDSDLRSSLSSCAPGC